MACYFVINYQLGTTAEGRLQNEIKVISFASCLIRQRIRATTKKKNIYRMNGTIPI